MSYPEIYPAYKKCLLPLIMVLAVFFVSQGIDLPDFGTLESPQLCASQRAKDSHSAFAKTSKKSSQAKTGKSGNAFALVGDPVGVKNQVVLVSNCPQSHPSFISSAVSLVSARAPPTT